MFCNESEASSCLLETLFWEGRANVVIYINIGFLFVYLKASNEPTPSMEIVLLDETLIYVFIC